MNCFQSASKPQIVTLMELKNCSKILLMSLFQIIGDLFFADIFKRPTYITYLPTLPTYLHYLPTYIIYLPTLPTYLHYLPTYIIYLPTLPTYLHYLPTYIIYLPTLPSYLHYSPTYITYVLWQTMKNWQRERSTELK